MEFENDFSQSEEMGDSLYDIRNTYFVQRISYPSSNFTYNLLK